MKVKRRLKCLEDAVGIVLRDQGELSHRSQSRWEDAFRSISSQMDRIVSLEKIAKPIDDAMVAAKAEERERIAVIVSGLFFNLDQDTRMAITMWLRSGAK